MKTVEAKGIGAAQDDADLVSESLRGNREAFGRIVERYQTLVCSIAYSATGNLSRSEDLAQETFIAAWRQLGSLREPGKLKGWLIGIARNLANNSRRRDWTDPASGSELFEQERAGGEPSPTEAAISNEEQAILWRALENIPELYREPMILFYRQSQSVGHVAAELDLTEDAVKQRLARGRKLLNAEVAKFVEGALVRSAPGRVFTFAVLAALPILPISAAAATAGATAAKGSSTASSMAMLGGMGAVLGPLLGVLGAWIGVRTSLASAKSERERKFILKSTFWGTVGILAFLAVLFAIIFGARGHWNSHGPQIAIALAALGILYTVSLIGSIFWLNKRLHAIQCEDAGGKPVVPPSARTEYKSRLTFLGWPLVHVNMGRDADGRARAARGWIAIGDIAIGGLAFGGIAIGGICFGGCAVGLLSVAGAALGLAAFGGVGIGWFAVGGIALGVQAFGGCSIAWTSAYGGAALARDYALGGLAIAEHANDSTARAAIEGSRFFTLAKTLTDNSKSSAWTHLHTVLISLPIIIIVAQNWWIKRRKSNHQ